ncbi:primosomal protein N' [Nakamurella sp. GG22]
MTTAPARGRPAGRPVQVAAARAARAKAAGARVAAELLPVARVLVDVPLAHLDRPYDYLVPEQDAATAQPGARVRVRFAGRLVGGYILERLAESDHEGRLGFVERVVSAEPVLSAEVAQLARAVADRYAGSAADVLRLAVPPRHAKVEAEPAAGPPTAPVPPAGAPALPVGSRLTAPVPPVGSPRTAPAPPVGSRPTAPAPPVGSPPTAPAPPAAEREVAAARHPPAEPGWSRYPAGDAFLSAVADRRPARAVWQAVPGENWPARLAELAAVASTAGVGVLLIVPDARELARLDAALLASLGAGVHVTLAADLGPAERYRRFLAVSRGNVRVVAGTRAAVFAPVHDLGLVAVFDDGNDLLAEPRAPYPHAREVLMMRSAARPCALLVAGFARTAEAQLLVESGWARPIVARRPDVRSCSPRIEAAGDDYAVGADSAAARARLSPAAFSAAREALKAGAPVLVQVPRRGYLPSLACGRCGHQAQCRHCRGPLAQSGPGGGLLACRWCGKPEAHFHCPACGFDRLRATGVGAGRTAEEIGRAFPGIPVITSSAQQVKSTVADGPALVVATPGAEPFVVGGYGAALLLDGAAMLGRPDLRAAEETVRRWMAAAAMVRPASAGGRVVVGADASLPAVQALIRWDAVGHAEVELAARRELGFPPAVAMASIEGTEPAVLAALERLEVPPRGEILGPVALEDLVPAGPPTDGEDDGPTLRALVRTRQSERKALGAALHTLAAGRSARKEGGGLRIRVDPLDLF